MPAAVHIGGVFAFGAVLSLMVLSFVFDKGAGTDTVLHTRMMMHVSMASPPPLPPSPPPSLRCLCCLRALKPLDVGLCSLQRPRAPSTGGDRKTFVLPFRGSMDPGQIHSVGYHRANHPIRVFPLSTTLASFRILALRCCLHPRISPARLGGCTPRQR